jgi:hypothetical protein
MKRFLRRLVLSLGWDDLFWRIVGLLGGLFFAAPGVAMSVWGATHDLGAKIVVGYWAVAILFIAWGGILVSRCVLSAQSRMARFIDSHPPDTHGAEEGIVLILIIYLPAALLTLLLRFFGIRGQDQRMILGKRPRMSPPGSLPRSPN